MDYYNYINSAGEMIESEYELHPDDITELIAIYNGERPILESFFVFTRDDAKETKRFVPIGPDDFVPFERDREAWEAQWTKARKNDRISVDDRRIDFNWSDIDTDGGSYHSNSINVRWKNGRLDFSFLQEKETLIDSEIYMVREHNPDGSLKKSWLRHYLDPERYNDGYGQDLAYESWNTIGMASEEFNWEHIEIVIPSKGQDSDYDLRLADMAVEICGDIQRFWAKEGCGLLTCFTFDKPLTYRWPKS